MEALEAALEKLAETGSAAEELSKEQLEITREVRQSSMFKDFTYDLLFFVQGGGRWATWIACVVGITAVVVVLAVSAP